MTNIEAVKMLIDDLSYEEQLQVAQYANKQAAETAKVLESLPKPVIHEDENFIRSHCNDKNIQREKIKFHKDSIELDGLKFPRALVKYEDVKNMSCLQLNENVYEQHGYGYFTSEAVRQLTQEGKKIPSVDQRRKAAAVFDRSERVEGAAYLSELFDYPKVGCFYEDGSLGHIGSMLILGGPEVTQRYLMFSTNSLVISVGNAGQKACPVVFLQD